MYISISALLQKIHGEGIDDLPSVVSHWTSCAPPVNSGETGHGIFEQSIVRFMRLVVSQRLSEMSEGVRGVLHHLYEYAISAFEPQVRVLKPATLSLQHLKGVRNLFEAWSATIAFGRCLHEGMMPSSFMRPFAHLNIECAPELAMTHLRGFARILSGEGMRAEMTALHAALLDAAVEELQSCGEDGDARLELLLASYLVLSSTFAEPRKLIGISKVVN